MSTHHRYFVQYLTDIGADASAWVAAATGCGSLLS